MATEEYKGPDTSYIASQVLAETELKIQSYNNLSQLRAKLEKKYHLSRLKNEESIKKARIKIENELFDIQRTQTANLSKNALLSDKLRYTEQLKHQAEVYETNLSNIGAETDAAIAAQKKIEQEKIQIETALYKVKLTNASKLAENDKNFIGRLAEHYAEVEKSRDKLLDKKAELELRAREYIDLNLTIPEELQNELTELSNNINEQNKILKDNKKAAQKDKAQKNAIDKVQSEIDDRSQKYEDAKADLRARFGTSEGRKNGLEKALGKSMQALNDAIGRGLNEIDTRIESFYKVQAKMEARLQGATYKDADGGNGKDITYKKMLKNISQSVGLSGLIRQTDVVSKLQGLIDQGVAYNIEGRAFLATVAENVASTFDATNPDLLRLIRIQQSDTTAARLGLEASLTRLFNEYFSDSSYLAQAFDSVSSSLLDVSSLLSKEDSVAFEYIVQKWIGALSSLGLSDSAAQVISQGLNYLGTGNVSALNNNSALQTLFAMSAGTSYADILTKGLSAKSTNDLLRNMVVYLKSIADNTNENLVVKSAYSDLLGISVSDLTAISNIQQHEIDQLYEKTLDYDQAITETQNQLNSIITRTHFSQIIDNSMDNILTTAATGLGTTGGYIPWKAANIIEALTGGIPIPLPFALGNGIEIDTTITQLMKANMAGNALLGQLLGSMLNGRMGGAMNLDSWKLESTTNRGAKRKALDIGSMVGVSQSTTFDYVGSSSSSDVQDSTLSQMADDAEKTGAITNKNSQDSVDVLESIYKSIGESSGETSMIKLLSTIDSNVTSIEQCIKPIMSSSSLISAIASSESQVNSSAVSSSVGSSNNSNGLGVIINGVSEDTKKYINYALSSMFSNMFTGNTTMSNSVENTSILDLLKNALSDVTLDVLIKNAFFDENQQRQAFGG